MQSQKMKEFATPLFEVFNSVERSNSAKFGEVRRSSMNIEMMLIVSN